VNEAFKQRLNKIIPKLLSKDFLESSGLGAEIGFYIFDYPPELELEVNNYIEVVKNNIARRKPELVLEHINLFKFLVDHLKQNKLLDLAIDMQKKKGDSALLNALKGPLNYEKLAEIFVKTAMAKNPHVILVSGVGSAYPLLRSHSLLNNLHHLLEKTPLVLFYPGVYDGQGLKLFSCLPETNYYRAFKLVP
jgi:hypothetical protein